MALLLCVGRGDTRITRQEEQKGKAMRKTIDEDNEPQDDRDWPHSDDDREMPELSDELMVEADERTPEEAGYGHGV
jgi:hypothetical protein